MFRSTASGRRLVRLTEAFNSDGFEVVKVVTYRGRIGIVAESAAAVNYDTRKPKKAYYLEGTPYESGFLMGSMAEEEISSMMDYADRVVFSFIGSKTLEKMKLVQEIFIKLVFEMSKTAYEKLPEEIREEIMGIYDGCKNSNPKTRVDMERLIVLNIGIDTICSMVYTGNFLKRGIPGAEPEDFDVPVMCNAFTVGGKSAGNGFYFGRDFTFPTADVFQDTAALIIYNPATAPAVGGATKKRTGILGRFGREAPLCGNTAGLSGAGGNIPVGRCPVAADDIPAGGYADGGSFAGENSAGASPAVSRKHNQVPFVNISAPGMVGSIAAMNLEGVALGVDMSPGFNCDPGNIGTNSLLMTRMCVQHGDSAESAAEIMVELPRGVSWLYIIADGKTSRSCVAEAGASGPMPDLVQIVPEEYRPCLPDAAFMQNHRSTPYMDGVMFRWNDYRYPAEYLFFNRGLWNIYNEMHKTDKIMHAGAFGENGQINGKHEQNCPSTFYFAPQREESGDILIATNHFIIPEMRFFSMHWWTERIIGKRVDDIQWRYDELNRLIRKRLADRGRISFEDARDLINFLSPHGENGDYHAGNPRSRDGKEIRIEGCISVFDLKNRIIESHYGYYCDKWTRLTLPRYFI